MRIRINQLWRGAAVACTALATMLLVAAPAIAIPTESGGGGELVPESRIEVEPVGDVITIDLQVAASLLMVAITCAALAAIALKLRRQRRV